MKLWVVVLLVACAPAARERRAVDPHALSGVTLGIPPAADLRASPGIGCGQVSQDLALRAHKLLVSAFSDAGASVTLSASAPLTLTVALRTAGMGLENVGVRHIDRPLGEPQPDAPSLSEPRPSPFHSGNADAEVSLESTLSRGGAVVWTGTVTGRAHSAPCMESIDKVREALSDAIDSLRDEVLKRAR